MIDTHKGYVLSAFLKKNKETKLQNAGYAGIKVSGPFSGPPQWDRHVSGPFSGPPQMDRHVSGPFSGPPQLDIHVSEPFSGPPQLDRDKLRYKKYFFSTNSLVKRTFFIH